MNNCVIYGSGQHSHVVIEIAKKLGYKVSFLLDQQSGESIYGTPVVNFKTHFIKDTQNTKFLVAIGDNIVRSKIYKALIHLNWQPINLVHPKFLSAN